jgi:hypothetical protein
MVQRVRVITANSRSVFIDGRRETDPARASSADSAMSSQLIQVGAQDLRPPTFVVVESTRRKLDGRCDDNFTAG